MRQLSIVWYGNSGMEIYWPSDTDAERVERKLTEARRAHPNARIRIEEKSVVGPTR